VASAGRQPARGAGAGDAGRSGDGVRSGGGRLGGAGRSVGAERRGGGRSGGGIPWLGLVLLVVIGGAVLAARTGRLPRLEDTRAAEPSPALVSQAATARPGTASGAPIALTATPKPVAAAPNAAPVRTSTPARAPVATRAPVAASTPTAASAPPLGRAQPSAMPVANAATTTSRDRVSGAAEPTRLPAAAGAPGAALTAEATREPAAGAATAAGATAGVAGPAAAGATAGVPGPAGAGQAGSVALTFDAGADRGYAQDILDLLQQQRIPASFGITGLWARANPDLVKRMAAEGHLIINHTLDHHSFTGVSDQLGGLSAARRRAELEEADAIIAPLVGHSTKPWYRLPYGDDDAQVAADVLPAGYSRKVGWTVDSLGWKGAQAPDIVARCLKMAAPSGVLIFHVGRASQDSIALPQVIEGLRERGFAFRRVDA
jgi:peptidoglycan-N-acetylglucosamine deacetylase